MKIAILLLTAGSFTAPGAYSQAAAGYGGAAATSTTTAAGAAGGLGRAEGSALSKLGSATASVTGGSASSATVQVSRADLSALRTRRVSAELAKNIDSNSAKMGDEVIARTTSPTLFPAGVRMPAGTRLLGKITEVRAKSDDPQSVHLAFAFTRAVLPSGRQLPIHASLNSISSPGTVVSAGDVEAPVTAPPIRVIGAEGSTVYGGRGFVASAAGANLPAISHLPGVTATTSNVNSTILDAKHSNIELESGTKMLLTVRTK